MAKDCGQTPFFRLILSRSTLFPLYQCCIPQKVASDIRHHLYNNIDGGERGEEKCFTIDPGKHHILRHISSFRCVIVEIKDSHLVSSLPSEHRSIGSTYQKMLQNVKLLLLLTIKWLTDVRM